MLDGLTKWLKVGRVTEALKDVGWTNKWLKVGRVTEELKDVGWTNKVAQSRKSDRSTERCWMG